MAASFIGTAVSVQLKPPRGWLLQGRVINVLDQHLFLENVYFPQTNHRVPFADFPGSDIQDIEVMEPSPPIWTTQPPVQVNRHPQAAPHPSSVDVSARTAATVSHGATAEPFVDPAILSMGRTPSTSTPQPPQPQIQARITPLVAANNHAAALNQPFSSTLPHEDRPRQPSKPVIPTVPALKAAASDDEDSSAMPAPQSGRNAQNRRKKETARGKPRAAAVQAADGGDHSSPEMVRLNSTAGSGWRQTPLLEEPLKQVEAAKSQQATESSAAKPAKKNRRDQQRLKFEQQNGFASEGATDVQDLGDFDFLGNLSKFDKRAVFDQLRIEDTTADEDRLVSHNRLSKPGTFGGQKLLPTEMVLEEPSGRLGREMADDSDVAIADLAASISSTKMEREQSRGSNRQSQRKDGSVPRASSRLTGRSGSHPRKGPGGGQASPVNGPASPAISTAASKSLKPCLRYTNSDNICLALAPQAYKSAEEAAFKQLDGPELGHGGREFNLTPDILNENAARNIAEAAIATISPGGRRTAPGNHNSEPVVVVLAGENASGARAIAAGRHLLDRGIRVIVTYLEPEEPGPESEQANDQLLRFNGKVMQWHQLSAYLKKLDAPPELIIDGLMGIQDTLDSISDRRDTILSMMAWANKSKASALAVDIPSGVNPEDGSVEVVEGEPAEMRAKVVVACGAPCTGILRAMDMRHTEGYADEWKIFVCDIGLTPVLRAFLKKKNKNAVSFGNAWMVPLRFDPGVPAAGSGRSG